MKKLALLLSILAVAASHTLSAQKLTAPQLIALAEKSPADSAALAQAIRATFSADDLKAGKASASYGHDFFFATETASHPLLVIDPDGRNQPNSTAQTLSMQPVGNPNLKPQLTLYYGIAQIQTLGEPHSYRYRIDGQDFGGSQDLAAFDTLSYLQPGVPTGHLSEKLTHISKIYDGMVTHYWIYVPAQYDPKTPATLMVFQDGEGYTRRDSEPYVLNTVDNLIASKQIPVMILVFINPGSIVTAPGTPTYKAVQAHAERFKRTLDDAMRSTLYDTVSDRYDRFLKDEILAEVASHYNLRKDAYSRAITGLSSGGICSFNAAWQQPDQFSRVLTWIGSFTNIQWEEQPYAPEGGQDYPDKVLRGPKRNLRVWLQDGANDMENPNWGSWPLANIRMANALKTRDYDFHFSFGTGTHNTAHGASEFPREMIWLWRDYDPAKTYQDYTIDPYEKNQPFFRVTIANREAN